MLNRKGQNALKAFIEDPNEKTEQLLDAPQVYLLLRFDRQQCTKGAGYSSYILPVCRWLLARSTSVLAVLLENSPPVTATASSLPPPDDRDGWEKVRLQFYFLSYISLCIFTTSQGVFIAWQKFEPDLYIPIWQVTSEGTAQTEEANVPSCQKLQASLHVESITRHIARKDSLVALW